MSGEVLDFSYCYRDCDIIGCAMCEGSSKSWSQKGRYVKNKEYNSLQGREHLWKYDKVLFLAGVCVCVGQHVHTHTHILLQGKHTVITSCHP